MLNIYEVQCSLNRAVSSVFYLNGPEDELNSLKLLHSALESLNIPNSSPNFDKFNTNSDEFGCNLIKNELKEDFNQFLDNLSRVLFLFSTRLLKIRDLNPEFSHLYIKIFLKLTNILKYYKFEYKSDILSLSLVKVWSEVLCTNDTSQINSETLSKNSDIFSDFLPLLLNVFSSLENEKELNKILYIILEIFRNTDSDEFIQEILESLEFIPCNLNVFEVYPGLVSRIVNKVSSLNRTLFSKSVDCLTVWFKYFLNSRNQNYSSNLNDLSYIINNKEDDDLLEKTVESISYIIKRFRNKHNNRVCLFCTDLIEYEFLDDNLKYTLAGVILDSITNEDIKSQICKSLETAPVSFKLILRDVVTKSINENDENSVKTFNSFLIISDLISWKLDNYFVLKFLLNSLKVDFSEVLETRLVNKKYLVDTNDTFSDEISLKPTEKNTISMLYFSKLTTEVKLDSISNLISLYEKVDNCEIKLRTLTLLNELTSVLFESKVGESVTSDVILNLKSTLKLNNMFNSVENFIENVVVMYKIRVIDLLTTLLKNCNEEHLTHYDIENLLFNIIPEYNSDYIKLSQSSALLLSELNNYFGNYVKKSEITDKSDFSTMLEYYSNSLVKKIVYNIDTEIIPDLVYTLTSFSNNSIDLKVIFDLTVQFCKYFDEITALTESNISNRLLRIFYSFNYILIYINNNLNHKEICDGEDKVKEFDETGKGDYILTISTLIITRCRYYTSVNNSNLEYLALLALYRSLILCSKSEYIFRIRVHEIWDCLTNSLELGLKRFRIVTILLEIFKLIAINSFQFIENRYFAL
uniref:Uncharacterized protein n=1 Tax=Theileria parva TaxID=5875 RepID=Q4N121_THEPA|eukprot:XP_763820.1 hypothetical protein [Theileria parva strain Muguga]